MLEWDHDLKIRGTELYLDSRQTRGCCFVSHAHSDHLGRHACAISTPATAAFAEHRLAFEARVGADEPPAAPIIREGRVIDYRTDVALDPHTSLRLLPAGHVLGSAMLHVTGPEGTLLYTGDFKLRQSLTVEPAEVMAADYLVMESTYGQPHFRFPPWRETAQQLVEIVETALRAGRQPIVMGYSLGKAQEITRVLSDAGLPVTCHGAVFHLNRIYERLGVPLGRYRRYAYADFHGPDAIDLRCRGVLVAPPHAARSAFVTRFKNPCRIVMTGWALLKGAQYRYGVDHALPLSDHADFDELLELIDRVRPKKVFTHHGFPQFVDTLRAMGIDATLARPAEQLTLFGD